MVIVGDSYSSAGAAAFKNAAKKNGINVCMTSSYVPNSVDMQAAMQRIMDARCCFLTVVFAQPKDTAALLLAAHKVHYSGEWLMGETVIDSDIEITKQLTNALGDTSEVYRLMKGTALLAYGSRVLIFSESIATLSFLCTTYPSSTHILTLTDTYSLHTLSRYIYLSPQTSRYQHIRRF